MENEDKRATVFVYRDVLGIQAYMDSPGLINDPSKRGQLGFVLDATEVKISKEAIDWLKRVKRGHGSFSEIEAYKTADGRLIFGWSGDPWMAYRSPDDISASSDFNPDILIVSDNVVAPEEFKKFVDEATDE